LKGLDNAEIAGRDSERSAHSLVVWKCRRCKELVDMEEKRCGCKTSPSPWERFEIEDMTKEEATAYLEAQGYDVRKDTEDLKAFVKNLINANDNQQVPLSDSSAG